MFGLGTLSRTQRMVLGILVLLVVDVIWVSSSELTEYIFHEKHYDKPYFSTYLKTSMFILYLSGFLVRRPWWQQCRKNSARASFPGLRWKLGTRNGSACRLIDEEEENAGREDQLLSDPIYVPVKFEDKRNSSSSECDDGSGNSINSRSVRFNNLSEVRQLSEVHAEEAVLARLSYSAYLRAEEARMKAASKLTVKQVAKTAFLFCMVFFFGNLAYGEALRDTQASIVNVLSSTSGLFTLVLSAMFPSGSTDRFTLSKFFAVALSIGGVVLVSLSDREMGHEIPLGALWALCGALLYAIYLVLLRRRVDNEDKLNIPMFFGFVGFFTVIMLWPGFFILHYSRGERFQWPDKMQWIFMLINGLVGTVLSELLWLWGCFLTSSLIATLSLSLTIPMTMIADIIIKDVSYGWMFYVGTGPVFISFFAVSLLTHWESWDPMLLAVKKTMQCICRRRMLVPRLRELDREQTESLIGINSDSLRGVDT